MVYREIVGPEGMTKIIRQQEFELFHCIKADLKMIGIVSLTHSLQVLSEFG